MTMSNWSLPCLAFVLSCLGCGLLRPLLRRWSVLDQPGARRLHDRVIVRGGGLMIVLLMIVFLWLQPVPGFADVGLLLALMLVAVTGLIDDVRTLSARLKLPLLAIGAVLLVLSADFAAAHWLPAWLAAQHWLSFAVVLLAVLWLINLFNFMDGSDGLAATQAVLCCAALLLFADPLALSAAGLAMPVWLLLATTLGFLPWNFPRARMFLGDVGSLSLGMLIAALLLAALQVDAITLPMAMLLPAVFLLDATATLLLRLSKRRKWYQAHTDHAYQQLVLSGWSHVQVWLLYLLVNIVLLWPLLWLQSQWPPQQWLLCFMGYMVLLLGWCVVQYRCGALTSPAAARLPSDSGSADRHV
jgi:Fuc2NAc and GlcNAc transferase